MKKRKNIGKRIEQASALGQSPGQLKSNDKLWMFGTILLSKKSRFVFYCHSRPNLPTVNWNPDDFSLQNHSYLVSRIASQRSCSSCVFRNRSFVSHRWDRALCHLLAPCRHRKHIMEEKVNFPLKDKKRFANELNRKREKSNVRDSMIDLKFSRNDSQSSTLITGSRCYGAASNRVPEEQYLHCG